jgi:hypothetical protein
MAVSRVDFPQPFNPSKPYRLPQHAHKISRSSSNHHDSADEHTDQKDRTHMQHNKLLEQKLWINFLNMKIAACPRAIAIEELNISHKNQEISILTIKKRQSKVNTSLTSHREFQRKEKTENKGPRNKKQKSSTNNSADLTPVQAPSTVTCMIVTSLSQLAHWLHQIQELKQEPYLP